MRETELTDELREIEQELERLRGIKATMRANEAKVAKTKKATGSTRLSEAIRRAGPGNVSKVEQTLVKLGGRATQHEITEKAGIHSGSVSYALQALSSRRRARKTGKMVRRSPEYEIVGSTKAPPGT